MYDIFRSRKDIFKDLIKKYGKESMKEESVYHKLYNILSEVQENTLAYHFRV